MKSGKILNNLLHSCVFVFVSVFMKRADEQHVLRIMMMLTGCLKLGIIVISSIHIFFPDIHVKQTEFFLKDTNTTIDKTLQILL